MSACRAVHRVATSELTPGHAGAAPDRERQATWCPCSASASAMAAPMPRLAPVTTMQSRVILVCSEKSDSFILEPGFALLHECLHAFLGIVGPVGQCRQIR